MSKFICYNVPKETLCKFHVVLNISLQKKNMLNSPTNLKFVTDVQFQGEGLRKINKCVWICALLIYGRPCQIQNLNWVLPFAPFSEVAFSVELLRWTFPTTDAVIVDKVSWVWKWVMLCNGFQVTQQNFEAPAKCIKSGFLEVEPALLQCSFQVQV